MTKFLQKSFKVAVGGAEYAEGWDRIFGKKVEIMTNPPAPDGSHYDPNAIAELTLETLRADHAKVRGPIVFDEILLETDTGQVLYTSDRRAIPTVCPADCPLCVGFPTVPSK